MVKRVEKHENRKANVSNSGSRDGRSSFVEQKQEEAEISRGESMMNSNLVKEQSRKERDHSITHQHQISKRRRKKSRMLTLTLPRDRLDSPTGNRDQKAGLKKSKTQLNVVCKKNI